VNRVESTYTSSRQSADSLNVCASTSDAPTGAVDAAGLPDGKTVYSFTRADSSPPCTSAQDGGDLPACRQSDQLDIRDPLSVSSGTADSNAAPTADASGSDRDSGSPGLSQVLGKVLQQLSVSAWVPAAMLVGNAAVLLQLHSDNDYNIARAARELTGKPLGTLIILAFSLILVTVVTQAFEFEVIRFLEGYFDSTNNLFQAFIAARIRRHQGKREKLDRKLGEADKKAREEAVAHMRKFRGYDPKVLDYIIEPPARDSKEFGNEAAQKAETTDWRRHAPPVELYRIESTAAKLDSYPEKNRLLPTRLGNVLRAAEDKIDLGEYQNLEGYVVRYHDQLSPALQSQHKEYRTRLDMYCSLTLVFCMLVAISAVALSSISPAWGTAIAVAVYMLMACLSYEAAIASARSYGLILQEIPRYLARQSVADETGESSALGRLLALLHRNAV
jgi:hypothetical protein